ncbi:MAG: cytochrome c [bacterium]|nr:cytochrome c [bacterium]
MKGSKIRGLQSLALPMALWVCLLITAVAAASPGQPGDETDDPEKERIVLGAVSYRVHCMNCHGDAGTGDGPMAEVLKVAPADLTRLARADGGEFPTRRVYRMIDGRDEILGHGSREMPVWGIGFQDLGKDTDQEPEVRAKILDLIAYLKSIQAVGEED